jgi:predicted enzyme involved in methoxymalonyl-ACP biosynthesis
MKKIQELKRNLKEDHSSLPICKVALLGDTATQFLAISLRGMGYEHGYNIDLFEAEYNQVERQVLDMTSDFYRFMADYTVVFQSTHKLLEKYSLLSAKEQAGIAVERLNFVRTLCSLIHGRIIYYNYPEIEDCVFGSYANKVPSSFTYQIRSLNFELMNLAQQCSNLFICDIAALQNKFGRNFMFDCNVYVNAEMVLSLDILPYISSRTLDIICAAEGRFKKCLILDLDNTLWGGVVGDDGWENIQIGHGLGVEGIYRIPGVGEKAKEPRYYYRCL